MSLKRPLTVQPALPFFFLLQPQRPPYTLTDSLVVLVPPVAPHLRGVNVGGALVVGFGEQVHDGEEDLLDGLDGGPPLGGVFIVVWIVACWMEDGDADKAAWVDYSLSEKGTHIE